MTILEKKLLYDKFLRDEIKIDDIPSAELKGLMTSWTDDKYKLHPAVEDYTKFGDELDRRRRAEIESVSKPKPIDHDFYKDK